MSKASQDRQSYCSHAHHQTKMSPFDIDIYSMEILASERTEKYFSYVVFFDHITIRVFMLNME